MADISKHKIAIGGMDDDDNQPAAISDLELGNQPDKLHNREKTISPDSSSSEIKTEPAPASNQESKQDLKFDEEPPTSDEAAKDMANGDIELDAEDAVAEGGLDLSDDLPNDDEHSQSSSTQKNITSKDKVSTKEGIIKNETIEATNKKGRDPATDNKSDKQAIADDSEQPEDKDFEPQWLKKNRENNKKHHHRKFKVFLTLLVIIVIATLSYPVSRHWLLDKSGWKRNFHLTFVDKDSHSPIPNLKVELDGQTKQTDSNGEVNFDSVGLGLRELKATKPGYSPIDKNLALEPWTRAGLAQQELQIIGIRLQFMVQDYLSSKPIQDAKVTIGDISSSSDKQGQVTVVIPPASKTSVKAKIVATGYHTQTVDLIADQTTRQAINLLPNQLNYFISNRSGTYDVYSSWLDGSHTEVVLPGSGQEDPKSLGLYVAPDNKKAFMISTRDGLQAPNGGSQKELFELDLQSAKLNKIDQGDITAIGWSGNYFVYTNLDSRKSYNDPARQALKSVDYKSGSTLTLAKTNYIIATPQIVDGQVYFSPNDTFNSGKPNFFSSINPEGGKPKPLIQDKIISQIWRVGYNTIGLQANDGTNYTYDTNSGKSSQGGAGAQVSRHYYVSPDGKNYAWVEQRDGKDTLLVKGDGDGKVVSQIAGLSTPLHWIGNNIIVFRVINSDGSYDYAVSLSGGQAHKITSVSKLGGN